MTDRMPDDFGELDDMIGFDTVRLGYASPS